MSYYKFSGDYYSRDSKRKINYYIYEPKCEIVGVLQISHGMCEYVELYEDFISFMTKNGWLVCGNDHLGHGEAALERGELGYFTEGDGFRSCVEDMHTLRQIIAQKFGEYTYVLMGHSMGSFIARAYVTKFSKWLDGAVFSGTAYGNTKFLGTQLLMIDKYKFKDGDKAVADKLTESAFSAFNNRIENPVSVRDWVSRDEKFVDKFDNDQLCNFSFTVNGFENLAKMKAYVSDERWYESLNKELPLLLISGREDPVGRYGKGVYKLFEKLSAKDCNVRMKLYSGMRHQIFNEIGKEEVYSDVLGFCENIRKDKK